MSKNIEDKIIEEAVVHTHLLKENIKLESDLIDDLEFDSLDVIEFVMGLEMVLDIVINDEEFEKWKTISDAVNTVKGIQNEID